MFSLILCQEPIGSAFSKVLEFTLGLQVPGESIRILLGWVNPIARTALDRTVSAR